MKAMLLLAAFALQPIETLVVDRVDCIEVNAYHDDDAELCFVQTIYWRWSDKHSRHKCEAWRMVNGATATPKLGLRPTYDYARQEWRATWLDDNVLRQVRSPLARRTYSQFDPEAADQKHYPQEWRRNLTAARREP
jgi:hypothetical protein